MYFQFVGVPMALSVLLRGFSPGTASWWPPPPGPQYSSASPSRSAVGWDYSGDHAGHVKIFISSPDLPSLFSSVILPCLRILMYSVMMLHSRSGPGGTQLSILVPENKIGMCDGICPCVQYNVHCPTQRNQTEKIDNQR